MLVDKPTLTNLPLRFKLVHCSEDISELISLTLAENNGFDVLWHASEGGIVEVLNPYPIP